jgi:hypothetical protein
MRRPSFNSSTLMIAIFVSSLGQPPGLFKELSESTCAGPLNLGKSLVGLPRILLYYYRPVSVASMYAHARRANGRIRRDACDTNARAKHRSGFQLKISGSHHCAYRKRHAGRPRKVSCHAGSPVMRADFAMAHQSIETPESLSGCRGIELNRSLRS